MKLLLLSAISFLCFSPLCLAQTVWPGDVNNNGIVNEVDFLYLGLAFNREGETRTNASPNWEAQTFTEWAGTFPDGLNFAYADCNGDGIIDVKDAAIIEMNFDSVHNDVPFVPDELLTASSGDPSFSFNTSNLETRLGDPVNLFLNLGSDLNPVKNLHGLAFTINANPKLFQASRTKFIFRLDAWFGDPTPENNTSILKEEEGKLKVTFTRGENMAIPTGGGLIGEASFVTIDDIIDLKITDTFRIEIDNVIIITDDLERIPVGGTSVDLIVTDRPTSTYNPILDKIKCYPNPTNGWLLLKSKEVFIERVELVNTLGQVVYHKQLNNTTFQSLDLQHIPEGMYWLRMITELGIKSTPIQRL